MDSPATGWGNGKSCVPEPRRSGSPAESVFQGSRRSCLESASEYITYLWETPAYVTQVMQIKWRPFVWAGHGGKVTLVHPALMLQNACFLTLQLESESFLIDWFMLAEQSKTFPTAGMATKSNVITRRTREWKRREKKQNQRPAVNTYTGLAAHRWADVNLIHREQCKKNSQNRHFAPHHSESNRNNAITH